MDGKSDKVVQIIVMVYAGLLLRGSQGQMLQMNSVHKTPAAERPANDLWCYRCDATDENDSCVDLKGNSSQLIHKCKDDKRICMVKRFSYTTSTENSTSLLKMWSLERNCTSRCEPGCIIIGERTKLYACTSCCENSLCNVGSGSTSLRSIDKKIITLSLSLLFMVVQHLYAVPLLVTVVYAVSEAEINDINIKPL